MPQFFKNIFPKICNSYKKRMEQNNSPKKQDFPHAGGAIYNMIGWLGGNRTTIYLVTAMSVLIGLFIYNAMPKEQFPEIVVPQMYIQTIYQGTAPADIENLINKPIEKQLKSVTGVKKVTSNALQDVSVILVEFTTDVKVEVAKQRTKDAIDKAAIDLPKDLTKTPSVQEVDFSEFPIINLNVAGNLPLNKLKDYAKMLQNGIETFPEVRRVDMVGDPKREIQINLDLFKMQSYGIAFYDIQQAVQGENVNVSGGDLNVDGVRRTIRVKGEFKNAQQIADVVIRTSTGATARIGDVAEVRDTFEEKQDFARLDNKSVITLNVIKRGGGNTIAAAEKIKALIQDYKINKFPAGLDVKITADSSERTQANLDDLLNTVILGFAFVVIVLMFFVGVRDAIFVALSVPLSALIAFLPIQMMGFSLNTIVLFAFLLGLGIVVDDAIVVIENAHRLFNKYPKLTIVEAVKLAASEVFIPVLTGTLTTIAPFVPLLFWSGLIGEFMKFMPWTLIFTLSASLIVAYVMNPVFAMSFMKRHDDEFSENHRPTWREIIKPIAILAGIGIVFRLIGMAGEDGSVARGMGNFFFFILILYVLNHFVLTPYLIIPFQNRVLPAFKNFYRRQIYWTIQGWRPVFVILSMFALLIFTFVMMGIVKPKVILFPSGEPDYIYVYNVMPIGTDARVTDSVTKIIEKRVFDVIHKNKAEFAVNSVISNVGKNAGDPFFPDRNATPHKSKVTIAFVKNEERGNISSPKILEEVRKAVQGIPATEISVQQENNGPPTGKPVSIEIAGDDFNVLMKLEKQVRAGIAKANIKGIEELKSDLVTNKPEIVVNVNREKASREGISSAQIAMAIRTALFGSEISKLRDDKDEYSIWLRLKPESRSKIEQLLSMNITYRDMNLGGILREVPLNSVADISYSTTFSQINRKNQQRLITLGSEVLKGYNANEIVQQIENNALSQVNVPTGYTVKMGGEQEEQIESMKFLVAAFGFALLMIYTILATQFNSLMKPVIIFVTIMLSLIGVFLGFMLFSKTFSIIMSGVGIIALAGIVVKNGILLIEFTDELRARGYPLREAIVEAGATRLTPVLLTASAAILGLVPLAFGITIDFGAIFSDLKLVYFVGGDSAAFWNILAWTIIYGLAFSTILTLGVVPCMYYVNERVREKFFSKKPVLANAEVEEEEVV